MKHIILAAAISVVMGSAFAEAPDLTKYVVANQAVAVCQQLATTVSLSKTLPKYNALKASKDAQLLLGVEHDVLAVFVSDNNHSGVDVVDVVFQLGAQFALTQQAILMSVASQAKRDNKTEAEISQAWFVEAKCKDLLKGIQNEKST